MWADGSTAPVRSKAPNRCPGCARAVAFENMTVLRIDAEENGAPGHVLTLTSRHAELESGAYRDACAVFWRAFRRAWGHVEYCGFIEWTTGAGSRSGGKRRMHSHWLVKGLEADELARVEAWCAEEWKKLTGAWIVQLAALESVGGVVGYLALHHEKLEQAPPAGWRGMRFRPSKGYFGGSVAPLRARARLWLSDRRAELAGMTEGERLTVAARGPARVVFRATVTELEEAAYARGPVQRGYFTSLPARRALDRQLCRAAALRADETLPDYYARRYSEMVLERALRSRAQRRLNGAGKRGG